ncbi:MAG: chemotaxis protein CheW [Kofleriaceae bacterium]|nr:chemotaxis protein CheW [Kofleriaceae bacterium]MCL4225317.1 chemotaxis protein CheW [Myxococcales bacterium]
MTDLRELVEAAGGERPAPTAAGAATTPCVGLRTGGRWFALEAATIGEVVALPPITRVPAAGSHVLGVAMLRSRLVPIVDLDRMLTGIATPRSERGRVAIVRAAALELGVVATETRGLLELPVADGAGAGDGTDDGAAGPEGASGASGASGGEREGVPWIAREVQHAAILYAVIDAPALVRAALGVAR